MSASPCPECSRQNVAEARYCYCCGSPMARLKIDREPLKQLAVFPDETRDFSVHFANLGRGLIHLECELTFLGQSRDWGRMLSNRLLLDSGEEGTLKLRVRGTDLREGQPSLAQLRVHSDSRPGSRRDGDRLWDRWCKVSRDFRIEVRLRNPAQLVVNRQERELGELVRVARVSYPRLFYLSNAGEGNLELLVESLAPYVRLPRPKFLLQAHESAPLPVDLEPGNLDVDRDYEAELVVRNQSDHRELERLRLLFRLRPTSIELPVLGVDFGTSSSKVALMGGGEIQEVPLDGKPLFPSHVYIHPDGRMEVGDEAAAFKGTPNYFRNLKSFLVQNEEFVEVRDLETGQVVKHDVHTLVTGFLRRLYGKAKASPVFRKWVGEGSAPEDVRLVVTMPARATPERRKDAESVMRRILGRLGFQSLKVLVEPTAVSYLYASNDSEMVEGKRLLVFDCGAGTTDVSILRVRLEQDEEGYYYRLFDILAEVGAAIGGNLFDVYIHDLVEQRITGASRVRLRKALWAQVSGSEEAPMPPDFPGNRKIRSHRLLEAVRIVKETMAREWMSDVPDFDVCCPDILEDKEIRLTRADLVGKLRPLIDKIESLCHSGLRQAGIHEEDVDRVYLVGGSSFLPPIRSMMFKMFDAEKVVADDQRLTSIARGAVASASTRIRRVLACNYICRPSANRELRLVEAGSIYPVKSASRVVMVPHEPPFLLEFELFQVGKGRDPLKLGTIPIRVDEGEARQVRLEYEVDEWGDLLARGVYESRGVRKVFPLVFGR
ncbi:MAG: Hsp70 family protein [Armatimonadetes bacterium]|nr:Hsp70 family protein [Armatimonadota bacterium]